MTRLILVLPLVLAACSPGRPDVYDGPSDPSGDNDYTTTLIVRNLSSSAVTSLETSACYTGGSVENLLVDRTIPPGADESFSVNVGCMSLSAARANGNYVGLYNHSFGYEPQMWTILEATGTIGPPSPPPTQAPIVVQIARKRDVLDVATAPCGRETWNEGYDVLLGGDDPNAPGPISFTVTTGCLDLRVRFLDGTETVLLRNHQIGAEGFTWTPAVGDAPAATRGVVQVWNNTPGLVTAISTSPCGIESWTRIPFPIADGASGDLPLEFGCWNLRAHFFGGAESEPRNWEVGPERVRWAVGGD